jgi:hypothetical protein
MKAAALALLLCCASAQADELQDRAMQGQAADVISTALVLTIDGVKEANPLGLAVLPIKAGLLYYADGLEDPVERADMHRALSATGWGPTANNFCVGIVVATGGSGAAGCLVLGLIAGIADWNHTAAMRERAAFDSLCADSKAVNPALVCEYTDKTTASDASEPDGKAADGPVDGESEDSVF